MGIARVSGYTTRSGRRVRGYTQSRRGGGRLTRSVSGLLSRTKGGGHAPGARLKRKARGGRPGKYRPHRLGAGSVIKPLARKNFSSRITTQAQAAGHPPSIGKRKRKTSRERHGVLRTPHRKSVVNQGKPKAAPKGGNKMPAGDLGAFYDSVRARRDAGMTTPSRKNIDGSKERARRKRRRAK